VKLDVSVETLISRARHEVASYVIDNRNDPLWIGGISRSELEGPPPIQIGSRVRRVASFLGKRIEYVNEVVRLEPDTILEMHSVRSPFPMRITYEFIEEGHATLTKVRVQGDTRPYFRLAAPIMRRMVRRSVSRDLSSLKTLLER
jgi:Polyketide cyclase / dehydrase and lipid transport